MMLIWAIAPSILQQVLILSHDCWVYVSFSRVGLSLNDFEFTERSSHFGDSISGHPNSAAGKSLLLVLSLKHTYDFQSYNHSYRQT